ncbi:MAG: cytochrome c oxidase subunit II [Pyrinomonadaceae bacterium]|nr:cytochrome c oxidase subunit II [Pyrinomonadaceae bacterium]
MGRALAVFIWVMTLATVWMFVDGRWWFPESITAHGPAYDRQFLISIIVVGLTFAAAQIGLGVMLWRYGSSRRGGNERAVYSHGSNRLEVVWTIVTAVIFVSLGLMGQRVWAQLHFNNAPAGSAQIRVTAQQFQWNFHYPGADNKFGRTDPAKIADASANFIGLDEDSPGAKDDVVVPTLAVQVDRPVELVLSARDVTHSIWVPELRFKQDLVPGLNISVHFTPVKTGKFELACAELCGQLHYKMKSYLLVLPENEYREMAALPPAQFKTRMTELLKKYPLGSVPH